ncbi:putative protein phosphatase 2c 66 [Quercus suber]|uniref:PPM-type phosphatase domain-containing protein n=1 Tax=Quercus suber TaxID=58331 RepID=A0AAW0LYJ2_QUESU
MGNGIGRLTVCFTGEEGRRKHHEIPVLLSDPSDEGLGHSFCYVRPDPTRLSSSKVHSEEETTTFKTISGASVSANTWTPLSTTIVDLYSYHSIDRVAAAFESSNSFASIPLQPIPRNLSGPMVSYGIPGSGPLERGFLSGPIERGFMSGPLDRASGLFSGPIDNKSYNGGGGGGGLGSDNHFQRSFSHSAGFGLGFGSGPFRPRSRKGKLIRVLQRALSKTLISRIGGGQQNSIVAPIKGGGLKDPDWNYSEKQQHNENLTVNSVNFLSSDGSLEDDESLESQNLQWAQGKAGEDRVHVVVSEEHGWVFVGIYDGFNGPDAPDYLLSNLYSFAHRELKGLLWDDGFESATTTTTTIGNTTAGGAAAAPVSSSSSVFGEDSDQDCARNRTRGDACAHCVVEEQENYPCPSGDDSNSDLDSPNPNRKRGRNSKSKYRGNAAKKWEENQRRWKCEWDRERVELDRRLKEQLNKSGSPSASSKAINHADVLKALSQALRKTEESYLEIADKMAVENPELALMGSCVLVMLMKGEDVYVMNVGDSRAVLAQKAEPDYWLGKIRQDLERINEETMHDLEGLDGDRPCTVPSLTACQLSVDHSTSVEEEVQRIKNEHLDDTCAVMNDRVKGSLKVTRAFGAGFLKQYFTNEEAVSEVELFITLQPEGDPAQHLVEEVLFRAAKKAGMDFHELLEIPQGDRRRYHDDVSIIVISLEGRIWKSCV